MKQRLLLTILSLFLLNVSILADVYAYKDSQGVVYSFDSSGSTASVYDGKSASGAVVIPEIITITYNNDENYYTYTVTSIGECAFSSCTGLTSITIPNSVTSIGWRAFSSCTGLTSVTIPNSVTSIGNSAFSFCSSLTSVNIPNSVTSIGNSAFYACISLTSISIPNSVTSIEEGAFGDCTRLTSITIPNSVTSIGNSAFISCTGLTSVTIPNSVMNIEAAAFMGCTGLTSITIPNSVTSIEDWAFKGCSGLTSIKVAEDNSTYDSRNNCNCIIETSSNTLIAGCNNSVIPNSVTSIGEGAFYNCTGLTSITIPNSVRSIGSAFYGCTGLKSIKYLSKNPFDVSYDCFSEDVYNTATLYVLYGCKEKVKRLYGWRNFKNIVELPEDYNDDNPYAGKFTIYVTASQGGSVCLPGMTVSGKTDSLTVIADEIIKLTLSLKADTGYRIASLKVDGINVTAQIVNNTYTITDLEKKTKIVATFEEIPVLDQYDINNDGDVNTADVTAIYSYIINGERSGFTRDKANTNGDNDVNTADVTAIYNYIMYGE